MTPAVTVLMPVLDPDPGYLRQAVASVVGQTFADWEFVIVEDPGPRSAAEVVAEFGDPRIRLIRNDAKTGFAAQLNRGLEEARADLVARMDADDVSHPERLARQLAYLRGHPDVAVVGSAIEVIDPDGKPLGARDYPTDHAAIVSALRRYNAIAHPAVTFRKAAVTAAGGYRPTAHAGVEDYELWCRLAAAGARFANLPDALLRYRIHPAATKRQKLRDTIRGSIDVKLTYWRRQFGVGDWLRVFAERCLLWLPASVVLRLFVAREYRKSKPLTN
jgi:glycosyltransferase involved in cell wall biosynthesis